MQTTPPRALPAELPPAPPSPSVLSAPLDGRSNPVRRRASLTTVALLAAGAIVVGILLGGRVSAQDGLTAARDALAAGNAGSAVTLDESIAARSGFLMLFDPGAASSASVAAQTARIAWARQLAGQGHVGAAIAALSQLGAPSLVGEAATTRTQILVTAAADAARSGQPSVALQWLDEAVRNTPPSMVATIVAMRAADEVAAASEQLAAGRAVDAVALLDSASSDGAAAAAAPLYPAALLASARARLAAEEYPGAAADLVRLVTIAPRSGAAQTARALLGSPHAVSGTLVDAAGQPASGRVRLGTHYSVLSGGYATTGPFYYGIADPAGDFSVTGVPVGGPYVLEYFRNGSWMTLVDPRTDQPANPVTVTPLTPVDLTFIVLPG